MVHFARIAALALLHHIAFMGVAILGFGFCYKKGLPYPVSCQLLDLAYDLLLFPVGQFAESIELWSPILLIASICWAVVAYSIWTISHRMRSS